MTTSTAATVTASIKVYAHDSGQRYNWAFSPESVIQDQNRWFDTAKKYNAFPLECIGKIQVVDLSKIDETDFYVG